VWHGNIFRLGDHLDRLLDRARKLRLDPGYSKGRAGRDHQALRGHVAAAGVVRQPDGHQRVRKTQGREGLVKLIHQVYIYAIPYLWAFPPHEQIFGTTAIVPLHAARRPQHRRPDDQELPVGRPDRRGFEARTAAHEPRS
jgi:branched-chain amino acid aminotransferase